ncbi:serine protease [Paradesertivirga mongoliensis]|uniref:Serine protease n=1 Tax=Paradesertivirga mongoliensis TaxID=2100740 RepID=A0ABW4ZNW7_9SPHI|nr:serine protease [Pedobacter mongoliensis]
MKFSFFLLLIISFVGCSGQEKTSNKVFEPITLVNNIQFEESKYDQPKFSCGFLLKYNADTFAITAKHLLKVIKPDNMKRLVLNGSVKSWSLYPLDDVGRSVKTGKLLNEDLTESLDAKSSYNEDWLVFSIQSNNAIVKPLEIRTSPLNKGEKLYVVGWTRKMEGGAQRVYEFEYFKTIGNRILLKDLVVPGQFGGLSGAPVIDERGAVVGLVSNGTVDPETDKKYFSPCSISGLASFLDALIKK